MYEKEIETYEQLRAEYEANLARPMGEEQYKEYSEILFSTHSCAIEGNSFTVDDTRMLKELGLGMMPEGHSLLECVEMADHFRAYEYVTSNLKHPFDEELLKTTNRLLTEHTLAYKAKDAVPGEYTTEDMMAGDTVFGEHEKLIARVPQLMESTAKAMESDVHPMIVAARFHGYYEYLHPFRDGNGRTGRLMSNYILLRKGHPLLVINYKDRQEYIRALRMIRIEGTDEYLVTFFFSAAIRRMKEELEQKSKNTKSRMFLF